MVLHSKITIRMVMKNPGNRRDDQWVFQEVIYCSTTLLLFL